MLANFARFPSSQNPSPLRPNVPRRTDSLHKIASRSASPSTAHQTLASTNALPPIFAEVESELRDARRVGTHGQEEDLRAALGIMIGRVEGLSTLLKEAQRTNTELETSLGLARSNLTLIQSNNEMLEEALKRGDAGKVGGSKDVGWRRWSAREGEKLANTPRINEERHRSANSSPNIPGSLTSPSMSSLHSNSNSNSNPNQEISEMRQTLDILQARVSELEKELGGMKTALGQEKEGRERALNEKITLEGEIESLSQALFEEANKMVVQERIRRAETEDELREAQREKDALKSALRVLEGENGRLRTSTSASASATAKTLIPALVPIPPSPPLPTPSSSRSPSLAECSTLTQSLAANEVETGPKSVHEDLPP